MMSATPVLPIVAVLDTNVVIAGLLWNGPPRLLLARATECDDCILATSPICSASSFFPRGIGCLPWFAPPPDSLSGSGAV